MNRPTILKERISIRIIGRYRFWVGVVVGTLMALLLSLGFNYSRESFRIFTSMSADLLMPSQDEFQFFNYFYSALSTALGLSLAIWIWMGNTFINRSRERLLKRLAQTNAIFNFWLPLLVIGRFASVLPFILFGSEGYDNHLNFRDEFGIIFYLIPIYTFMQGWIVVQLVYKSFKWIGISLVVCTLLTITFSYTTSIDQRIFNQIYLSQFEEEYDYIDSILKSAENKYDIVYNKETIEVLKKWHTESSMNQIQDIKGAFSNEHKVSMDTIILARIIVHNFKKGHWANWNSIDRWYYPFPQDIYNQIRRYNSTDPEVNELFYLLKEQIDLANKPEIPPWEQFDLLPRLERRRIWYAKYQFPIDVRLQLTYVYNKLIMDSEYQNYHYLLQPINNRD